MNIYYKIIFLFLFIIIIIHILFRTFNLNILKKQFDDNYWRNWQYIYRIWKNVDFNKRNQEFLISINNFVNNYPNKLLKNYKIYDIKKSQDKFQQDFLTKSPPKNLSFIILINRKEGKITILANHSICDGLIIKELCDILLNDKSIIRFPKYKYYPIISDLLIYKYLFQHLYQHIFSNHKELEMKNNTNRFYLKKELKKKIDIMYMV